MATRQLLGELTFTHEWYNSFLTHLKEVGYTFETFPATPEEGTLLLRHDVDLSPSDALTMARIEAELNIQSTYCILVSSPLYNPFDRDHLETIHQIQRLGHDIALHFSTHNYWKDEEPSNDAVESRVLNEMDALRTLTPELSEAVSFHRPPEWALDRDFDGFINTYSPQYFSEIEYISESSQRWRTDPPDFENFPNSVQLLIHPGLWSDRDDTFEKCIERSVVNSCRYVNRRAQEEFIEPTRSK